MKEKYGIIIKDMTNIEVRGWFEELSEATEEYHNCCSAYDCEIILIEINKRRNSQVN